MNKDRIKTFADKVYADMAGAMAMGMAYIGVEKGLFRAMAGKGPMTKDMVVAATRLQDRYVEEWLSGMTTAGISSMIQRRRRSRCPTSIPISWHRKAPIISWEVFSV